MRTILCVWVGGGCCCVEYVVQSGHVNVTLGTPMTKLPPQHSNSPRSGLIDNLPPPNFPLLVDNSTSGDNQSVIIVLQVQEILNLVEVGMMAL